MSAITCPKCGSATDDSNIFCPRCGAALGKEGKKAVSPGRRKSNPRYGDWLTLGFLAVLTVLVYNLVADSRATSVASESQMPISTDSFTTAVNLGHTFMDRGMYDHAIAQYQRALELDSLQPDIMVDLGACFHAVGELDEAVFQFKRSLAQQPNHAVAMFNMGVAQLSRADTAAARTWWEKFLEVAPDAPQAESVRKTLEEF